MSDTPPTSETQMTDAPTPTDVGVPLAEPMECAEGCPIHAARGPMWITAGWLAAAVASTFVAAIPYDASETLCGVWGCFPPLPSLVSLHLLWLVGFGASVWVVCRWFPYLVRPLGFVLLLTALVTTGVVLSDDLMHWMSKLPEEYQRFWPQRIGYRLLTLTDVPLLQSLLAGVFCIIRGRG